ncbi:MAG: VapC toxin family PIN domain ribonuclease [Gammaproteobacteria bacterium]|nr:MAG: VapC toxin family PIN domain ribonuclease [Gammaproteobacteria bacterium]
MNVIDSSAWLSYFAGDKNSSSFSKPIESLDLLLVPSIVVTEVFKHVLRLKGEELALEVIAHITQGKVISLDSQLAIDAGSYGVLHKLPLADSIIYATTMKYDATLWTQDSDFKGLPNVKFYAK